MTKVPDAKIAGGLTNATSAPVADNTNILTAGPRGRALLEEIWLIEKRAHYDREAIPERRMNAKGGAAQPGNLFRLMTREQQKLLYENTARALGGVKCHIQERHIANCKRGEPAYGAGVARALGIP